jgi:elongation factor Ts
MAVSLDLVKKLRELSGAGMMDCKQALEEAGGDVDKAFTILREKGIARASKRADRTTGQGVVEAYLHSTSPDYPPQLGVLIEVNCETDFVARNDAFRQLCKDLAVHILGANPKYVRREDMPGDQLAAQKKALEVEVANKPEAMREKIVEGKLARWAGENHVLMDQPFVKDDAKTIRQLVQEVNARTGENITIGRFARFIVGEAAAPAEAEG